MSKKKTAYVVPHTHWDREWRYPLWENRLYLRDLMDELLEILEKEDGYRSFLMDGQVAAIQDYLEIRPEKREQVKKLIAQERIQIGPWYTLPDLYPISGESLVRNLLKGKEEAASLGGYLNIGYESFGWGQPSQLPQLYKGFGIDTVIVSKNVDKERAPKCEFIWKGADGTKVLATRLGNDARANFFMNAYLKIMTGKEYKSAEYEYHYGQDGQVYHQADGENYIQDYFRLEDTESIHKEYVREAAQKAWDGMKDTLLSDDRIMMDGTDSTTAQPRLMELLEEMNQQCEDINFKSSSLGEYVQVLKEKLPMDELIEIQGEMRDGPTTSLSGNALMTRPYIKTLNKEVQSKLFGMAEPISSMLYMLGEDYEEAFLNKALDYLLLSHPHDSINGVTQDKTVDDVMYRLSQAKELAETVYNRGLQKIIKKIDYSAYDADAILLVVFNPTLRPRKDMVKIWMDTPKDRSIWDFTIEDSKGNKREIQTLDRTEHVSPVVHLQSRPYPYYTDRHCFLLDTGEVPAGGYEVYQLKEVSTFDRKTKFWAKTRKSNGEEIASGCDRLENEHLRVQVNQDGSVTILDKRSNESYGPLNYFESTGDVGDYWMYYPPYQNQTFTSKGQNASIHLKENGNLAASIGVDLVLELPAFADRPENYIHGKSRRSKEKAQTRVSITYTLKKESTQLDVELHIENGCKDHRMSVIMDTGVHTDMVDAQGHFTVDHRSDLPRKDQEGYYYNELTTQPMQGFASVVDEKRGFGVITDCLGEYELRKDKALSFTLFRAVRNIICTEFRSEGAFPNQEGGQLLRTLSYRYALVPQVGDYAKERLGNRAEELQIPLKPVQTGIPLKANGTLPASDSFFCLEGDAEVSCLKKGKEVNSLILRVCGTMQEETEVILSCKKELKEAYLTDLKEDILESCKVDGTKVRFPVGRDQIKTIKLVFA